MNEKTKWKRPGRVGLLITRALLALTLIALFPLAPAAAQDAAVSPDGPMPTWNKIAVDAPPYWTNMTDRSLAFNPITGEPCVVYGGDALYYSCYNSITDGWPTQVIDGNLQVGEYAAITFDQFARPFITYYDAYNAVLKLAIWTGATWWIEVVPDEPNIYPDGTPVTTAYEEAMQQAARDGTAPAEPTTELQRAGPTSAERVAEVQANMAPAEAIKTPDFDFESYGYGKYSSIAVDPSNGIHITYYDEVYGSMEYQYFDGETWDGKVVDDYRDQHDTGLYTSVKVGTKVDNKFTVHIAYMSDKYDDLMYGRYTPGRGWIVETVDSEVNTGAFASMALDSEFRPHISYYDFSNNNLMLARRDTKGLWHKQAIETDGMVGWYSSIAIDLGDNIHISYYDVTDGILRYAYINDEGGIDKRTLDVNSDLLSIGVFTSIAIDRFGNPGIFYTNKTNGALKYVHRIVNDKTDKFVWLAPVYINYYARDVGIASQIAIDPTGVPFISYMDATLGMLKYARSYGNSWYKNFVLTYPHSGLYSDLDIGPDGVPHIAFYDQNFGDLMYAAYNQVNWNMVDADATYNVGKYPSIAMDGNNIPHMAYYDVTHKDLIYASWNILTSDWYTQTIDHINTPGWYTDIAVNSSNMPFVSYYDPSTGVLKMAYKSFLTMTWIWKVVEDIGLLPDEGVGAYSSIQVDSLGNPHIIYFDLTHQDLKYAFWEGTWPSSGVWNISVVDAVDDVGRFASMALYTPDNTRHVCYYDATNGNLKYARWQGAGPWEFQVVDGAPIIDGDPVNEGDVGMYCDIDVDRFGNPAISYYDNSRGDLKIALSYALPPMQIFLPIVIQQP